MAIEYGPLRGTTARELISALVRDGFVFDRGSGSHQIYRHCDGRRVTVTFHGSGDTFAPKTFESMIETEAKWAEEDLKRLKLIR
ncbi:type II toxin-antitoxin system HicA family toxin [Nevskia soli]|uniref:type II toxin-antitoxin system HicA family toxin n=1 Tax=Nevskia soli TaxID=418856 RepID=UPI0015D72C82